MMALKLVKNRCYHVEGWKQGTQFRLLDWSLDTGTAVIQRPLHGRKKWRVPISKIRNTNRHRAKKAPISPPQTRGGVDEPNS